jgi:hypothetical protein
LLRKTHSLVASGQYASAKRAVWQWKGDHRGSAFEKDADTQVQRIDMVANLLDVIVSASDRVVGTTLTGDSDGGEIHEIRGGRIWIKREIGDGEILNEVALDNLSDDQILQLLETADPRQAKRHRAVWLLAQGKEDQAQSLVDELSSSGQHVAELEDWIKERQQFEENLAAYRGLIEVEKLLRKKEFEAARSKFSVVSVAHRNSQVFRLNTPEVRKIRKSINQLPAADRRSPWSRREDTDSGRSRTEVDVTGKRDRDAAHQPEDASAVPVGELSEELYMRDGESVKIKYLYRGELVDAGSKYMSTLHDKDGRITVSVPRIAQLSFRRLPETSDGTVQYIYGTVNANDGCVDLKGIRIRNYVGGRPQYTW